MYNQRCTARSQLEIIKVALERTVELVLWSTVYRNVRIEYEKCFNVPKLQERRSQAVRGGKRREEKKGKEEKK